ncbi:SPA2L protein, partial [Brachypteracias leptosomus]|nr:SPA2L protein [Brachypteracias leptosomus]
QRLRQRLRQEPAVLGALQEDGPAMVAHGLQEHPDPGLALRGLAGAFQLLETVAVNLYLFPWRKEFSTIQTFSGAYVHSLRPVLPEADLERSLARLGYDRDPRHLLTLSRQLPGAQLVAAACGFFACRLECEVLAELVTRLRPHRPRPQELLEARRVAGDTEACLEMLLGRPRTCPEAAEDCLDLYRETPATPEGVGGEDAPPPALWRDLCGDAKRGQENIPAVGNPDLDTSSPLLEQELGGVGRSSQVPGEPQDSPPAAAAPQEAPELPCYQLHSCLRRGTLPSYCCTTCQQLHGGTCARGQLCRSRHRGQELRSERQQRLWLQRTEVDMLLAEGSGPWS